MYKNGSIYHVFPKNPLVQYVENTALKIVKNLDEENHLFHAQITYFWYLFGVQGDTLQPKY